MPIFDGNLPYTNLHELNLDWIVKFVKETKDKTDLIDEAVEDAKNYSEDAQESRNDAQQFSEDAEGYKNRTLQIYEDVTDYTSSLNTQVSENTSDIATQTARIDSIISGTTPDANVELIDIRVRYNGETYPTAGDSVRGQIEEVLLNSYPLNYIHFEESDWELGSIYSTSGVEFNSTEVIRTKTKRYIPAGTLCRVPAGYRYELLEYRADNTFIQSSGWLYYYNFYEISGGYFRVLLSPDPAATTTTAIYDNIMIGNPLYIRLPEIYSYFETIGTRKNFEVVGEKISLRKQYYAMVRKSYTLPAPSSVHSDLVSRQDFAIYNGKMFQLYDSDYVSVIDVSDGTVVNNFPINCGHGNSCQFSNEFYDVSDTYPLLYCFAYTSGLVYVNRVTDSSATLVKTLKLNNLTGYRFSGSVNEDGTRLYVLNYHLNSSTTATNNYCIFSVMDLTNLTDNGDSTFTPALISSTEIPFIGMIQGAKVFGDKLFIACGGTTGYTFFRGIQAINISNGLIVSKIPYRYDSNEPEGIDIIDEGGDYNNMYFTSNRLFTINLSV